MTQKTAIMQAIDKIDAGAEALNEDFNSEYNYKLGMLHAKKILLELLATEKEQLIRSYKMYNYSYESGEDFYNSKYGQ